MTLTILTLYRALRYDLGLGGLAYLGFGWRGLAVALVLRAISTSLYNQALAFVADALEATEPPPPSPEE